MKTLFRILPGLALPACLLLISSIARAQPTGYALEFNGGAGNYVSVNLASPPINNYTLSAWVYLSQGGSYAGARATMLGGPYCGSSIEFMIRSQTSSSADPQYLELGRCDDFDGVSSSTAVPTNAWVHVAVTVTSAQVITYYINGSPAGSWSDPDYDFSLGSQVILADNISGNRFFTGALNDVQIWNRVLSQSEIQTYINSAPAANANGLYAWYPFTEGSGSATADAATLAGGSTGALVNSPAWVPATVTVATLPATAVSNPNATLNGSVTCGVPGAQAWFQWGVNTNYGNSTTPVTVGAGSTVALSATLSNLASEIFHYRAVASDPTGLKFGQDQVFWPGLIALGGANPFTNECHTLFTEPGATVGAAPVTLACGYFQDLALRVDGTVAAWGTAYYGQQAYGQVNVPGGLNGVSAIAVGNFNSMALRTNGTVVAWGRNDSGKQVVSGANGVSGAVAIAVGAYHGVAAKTNGVVVAWGDNTYNQTAVPASATNVIAVAAGDNHTVALRSNGTVVAWGAGTNYNPGDFNDFGQSIVPAKATNIVAISASGYFSVALTAGGNVLAWGAGTNYNAQNDFESYGQCIVPANATNVIAIATGDYHTVALRADGSVLAWGDNTYGQTNIPVSVTNIAAIKAGGYHTFALRQDGTWIGWGDETALPATATNLTTAVTESGSVNTNSPGSYFLTYTFTNAYGFVATNTRTVVVADRTPPALTLFGANPLYLTLGASYVEPGYSAPDACQGDLTGSVIVTGTVNSAVIGANILTYTVTDSSGNTAVTNRTVIIPGKPAIVGLSFQIISTNSITGACAISVTASVIPKGLPGAGQVQYGLNTSYPGVTPYIPFALSFLTTNLTQNLSNLIAGVTYHFRAVATNSMGSVVSSDYPFFIPSPYQVGDLNGDGIVDGNEYNVVLSNYLSAKANLLLTNVAGLGQSNVTFSLAQPLGGAFSVNVSTNFSTWQYLGPANPFYEFTDTNAPAGQVRFYRISYP